MKVPKSLPAWLSDYAVNQSRNAPAEYSTGGTFSLSTRQPESSQLPSERRVPLVSFCSCVEFDWQMKVCNFDRDADNFKLQMTAQAGW